MDTKNLSFIGLLLAGALFIAVNLFAAPVLRGMRADLTEQKLYTLSDGTKNILGSLDEKITLRFFFSKSLSAELPPLLQYAERVREMLEEYVARSNGKLELEIIDPEPFSEAEELAVGYGIQGAPNRDGDVVYFGIVGTNSVDDEELLPALDPRRESYLEYELSEMIDRLENPERPVVGLVTGLPLSGGMMPPQQPGAQPQQTPPWAIMDVIRRQYELQELAPATLTEIPEDIDLLLLVHPKGLTPAGTYAIDQFALNGGKIVAFVDSYAIFDPALQSQDPMAALNASADTGIDPLLKAWGITVEGSTIGGDASTALGMPSRDGREVRVPIAFDVTEETLDSDDILVSSLKQLRFFMPAVLRKDADAPAGADITILASTTEEGGGSIDAMSMIGGFDPQKATDAFTGGKGALALGMRVRGTVRTAFPDGAPSATEDPAAPEDPASEGDDAAAAADHLSESAAPFNAIVIADADMLQEQIWARQVRDIFGGTRLVPQADNGALLVSALENLAGSNDLIGLRSRAEYQRPFTRKEELLAAAQEKYREKELELEAKLTETEQRINELQTEKDPSSALLLSPEQEEEIAQFRDERLATRRSLRKVKRDLRKDIDRLGTRLKLFNIFALPMLIAALVMSWYLARAGRTGGAKS